MTGRAIVGALLALLLAVAAGCGDGDGDEAPAGYKRVENSGMSLAIPSALDFDEARPGGNTSFVARTPGTFTQQPRVVGSVIDSSTPFAGIVAGLRRPTSDLISDFRLLEDGAVDVPGADEAYRAVQEYVLEASKGVPDTPTTGVTIAARKGTRVHVLVALVPKARSGELDGEAVADSLRLAG